MMNNEHNFIGPVNLGNPKEMQVRELAETVLSMIPESKSQIVFKPLPADDPKQRRPDISLAKQELSWQPSVPLNIGLDKTINYFKKYFAHTTEPVCVA